MARSEERNDLLTYEACTELDARSYPNGVHIAEVEIDPERGEVTARGILRLMILEVVAFLMKMVNFKHGGMMVTMMG